jgi:triosephosphate isomerase
MRTPLIAGNWKMFLDRESGIALAKALAAGTGDVRDRDMLVCPSSPLLGDVATALKGSRISLGAQNLHYEEEGAFTGEVSAKQILSVGCTHVIIGHSERRHVFMEKDDFINKKVLKALDAGLRPILCVGELLEEREAGKTEDVVKRQIVEGLKGVEKARLDDLVVAYEPVWAIGTGRTATPEDADGVHGFIRTVLAGLYDGGAASSMRILYGGSVKPANVDGLMARDNIDGALVGGASLKADSFLRIVRFED